MRGVDSPVERRRKTPHASSYNALVFGASGGIGAALEGVLRADRSCKTLITLSRTGDEIDITDEASLEAAVKRLNDRSLRFDLIINAAGILDSGDKGPEKAFREIDAAAMANAFAVNAIGGALFLKHFMALLRADRPAVLATLSARIGSIGDNRLGGWMSYRASKAALNQIIRCASVEAKRINKQARIIALHPGTIKTPLTEKYAKGAYTASREEAARNLLNVCANCSDEDNGGFFDYAGRTIPW